ncbi:hypothetical protein LCGC14_1606200 [marine sediment metagenome]|uniref:Uncharacterized protein n=1 Tax=marine sediment metagenome TaxID=412755 RepID=A0A0F9KQG7_9ZZZZ|nr:hypothetical protein [Methylophaga sp.]
MITNLSTLKGLLIGAIAEQENMASIWRDAVENCSKAVSEAKMNQLIEQQIYIARLRQQIKDAETLVFI